MRRKIENELLSWKITPNRKCLIVEGARQVGKTYSIKSFIKQNYTSENSILVNFIDNPELIKAFDNRLDEESIIGYLKVAYRDKKFEKGRTIIFFDEIQVCPRAITALKYIDPEGKYDIIASGSLLGISYSKVESFPVGYVDRLTMHSLDFEEFLWAEGFPHDTVEILRNCFDNLIPVNEALHMRIMEWFNKFVVVGGMPEVVAKFIINHDFNEVLEVQQRILRDYKDDIAKYALEGDKVRARECFDSIPRQLGKDYKKFQYKLVSSNGRSSIYTGSIQWLMDAGIVLKCSNLVKPEIPLIGYIRPEAFKIYVKDTGLFVSMLGIEAQSKILFGDLGIFNGGVFENIIADIFSKTDKPLYYFERNSTLEIDFIIIYKGNVAAIEVKSAANTKSKSLNQVIQNQDVKIGIKLSSKNLSTSGQIIGLPLYMAMFL